MAAAADQGRALTEEQVRIVQSVAGLTAGQRLVVEARAGTGKTTTIGACVESEFARRTAALAEGGFTAVAQRPMLYTCFNRHTRDEADRKLPHASQNDIVQCHTYHALATRFVRDQFSDTTIHVAGDPGGLKPWSCERQILDRYWKDAGSELAPSARHVNRDAHRVQDLSPVERSALDRASALWSKMLQGLEPAWPHNATLKYFALERTLSETWLSDRYSIVFIDEAQDVQAVLLEWIKALRGLPVVLVGDPFQSIYGWAGARDAMRVTDDDASALLHLTHSFRFAPPVAAVATALLRRFALIESQNVGVIGAAAWPSRVAVVRARPRNGGVVTYLARTNRILLRAALTAVNAGRRVALVGRSKEAVDRLRALADRYGSEEQVRYRITSLERRAALTTTTTSSGGAASAAATTTLEPLSENEQRDLDILRLFLECSLETMRTLADHLRDREKCNDADTVLSTVHAFKGLEADRVTMLNDFPCLPALRAAWSALQDGTTYDVEELVGTCRCGECHQGLTFNVLRSANAEHAIREEVHLYYVAMTRAKRVLTLNRSARSVFADLVSSSGAHSDYDDVAESDDCDGVNPTVTEQRKQAASGQRQFFASKNRSKGFASRLPAAYRKRVYNK